jgi:hypothetical protein
MGRIEHEAREQEAVAAWLDIHGVLWFHPPNGGHRNKATASALRRQGVKPGVPDIIILDRPTEHPECRGCAVELKAPKGQGASPKPSMSQLDWIAALRSRDWLTYIAYGATDCIQWLQSVGYGRR